MAAQHRTVDVLARQEHLESVALGIALKQGPDPQDQLVRVGRAAADVHGDGDLHGQGQHLQVLLAQAIPPHLKGVLTELDRLDMAAAQVQPPDLIDDERAQGRILCAQEPLVGLEVLEGEVVDLVTAALIRIAGVRARQ